MKRSCQSRVRCPPFQFPSFHRSFSSHRNVICTSGREFVRFRLFFPSWSPFVKKLLIRNHFPQNYHLETAIVKSRPCSNGSDISNASSFEGISINRKRHLVSSINKYTWQRRFVLPSSSPWKITRSQQPEDIASWKRISVGSYPLNAAKAFCRDFINRRDFSRFFPRLLLFSSDTRKIYVYIYMHIYFNGVAAEPFPEYKGECINKDAGSLHPSPVCFSPSVTSVGRSIRGIINDGRDERCGKVIRRLLHQSRRR